MTGFYTLKRGWMDNPVFGSVKREPFSRRDAWVWLVEHAAYRPTSRQIGSREVVLTAGQLMRSVRELGAAWGWDAMKVSRYLKALADAGMVRIEINAEVGRQIITIIPDPQDVVVPEPASTTKSLGDTRPIQRPLLTDTLTETPNIAASDCVQFDNSGSLCIGETVTVVSQKIGRCLTETGKERKKEDISPIGDMTNAPAREVAERMAGVWKDVLGDILSIPTKLTPGRIAACYARWKDSFGRDIEQWRTHCGAIRASPFLCGDAGNGNRNWKADFDWALSPKYVLRVQEGKYRGSNGHQTSGELFGDRNRAALDERQWAKDIARRTVMAGRMEGGGPDAGSGRGHPPIIDVVPDRVDARDSGTDRRRA